MPLQRLALLGLLWGACGCALRSDVTRLRLQLAAQERERQRADSIQAANTAALARLVQTLIDSLATQQQALGRMRGDLRVDLYNVQQQLVAIQELTGQSQQRLTELRTQLEQRSEQLGVAAPASGAPAPAGAQPPAAAPGAAPGASPTSPAPGGQPAGCVPSADQLMEIALQQLRRGSPGTARVGFAEFLRCFPTNARAGDAEFFVGESWAAEQRADSASAAYRLVVQRYPGSPRAPAALYKLGLQAAQAGRRDEARTHFNRLVNAYPSSQEAALARDQLRALAP